MFFNDIKKILEEIRNLKEANNFRIIDSHVHPFDVMGVIHNSEHRTFESKSFLKHDFKPSLIEILQYGRLANFLSQPTCFLAPEYVNQMMKNAFVEVSQNRLFLEMQNSLVDQCILVPIEPWSLTSNLYNNFKDSKFLLLGSIDIHNIKYESIHDTIVKYKNDYGIKGIKLHPNLQNFHPQPSYNEDSIKKKLFKIYEEIEKNKLYLLIHGGKSFFTNKKDDRFSGLSRSRFLGKLENFISGEDYSELFNNFNMPIIIAHLGHYGFLSKNLFTLKRIINNHKNVYFDTAGTSPALIKIFLDNFSSDRMVFGSDAIYNRMLSNVVFSYMAIKRSKNNNFIYSLHNVFEDNMMRIINN